MSNMSFTKALVCSPIIRKLILYISGFYACQAAADNTFYTVHAGHRAIIYDRFRGILRKTAGEGTHVFLPWIQKPFVYSIRARPYSFTSVSGTKDLQMVQLTVRILSRPDPNLLPEIFDAMGGTYEEIVFPSITNDILQSTVSQFNADQLLTDHHRMISLVQEALTRRAKNFHIVVDDVAITDLSYSSEFSKAVEEKQLAQQAAERAKLIVMKTEQESRAAVIHAEGESECAKMISDAVQTAGKGLIELRKIEAAKENAAVLCRKGEEGDASNVWYMPPGNNLLLGVR